MVQFRLLADCERRDLQSPQERLGLAHAARLLDADSAAIVFPYRISYRAYLRLNRALMQSIESGFESR